ncbi:MAG TPA: hypothetical protein VFY93_01125 [Planctomycetota bacterium]|nr:hypothetical protein [Planctomycetota bacterium]
MVPARGLQAVLLLAAVAGADVAVPETGPVFKGVVKVDTEKGEALLGEEPRALREILVIERQDGTLVWCDGFERRLAGYRRMVSEGRRDRLVQMIKDATRARDPELARRLLDLARAEGFSGKDEDIQRRRVENLEKRPGKRNDAMASELRRAAASLEDELPDLLVARAKGDAKGDGLRLLREALRVKPEHAGALAAVTERVPKTQPFPDLRTWLEWAVAFECRGFHLVPEDHQELKKAQHYWRPDLMGIASSEVLVVTPLRDMEALREVVLRAHIVCAKLRELFRTDHPLLRPEGPILIYLYANKDNFQESLRHPITNPLPPYFQFAHARFDRQEDLTQILWVPAGKERSDLLYAVAHTVARHWLWSRNPRYSLAQTNAADADVAGYWAEIGLFGAIAEANFDLDNLSVDLGAGAPASRKFVREHSRELLPWGPMLLYGRGDLHAMNEGDVKRGDDWASYVFDRQAVVLSHYLLCGEGGARRAQFLDFFVYRCLGQQPKLAPTVAFGMSADDLGAAALRWSAK